MRVTPVELELDPALTPFLAALWPQRRQGMSQIAEWFELNDQGHVAHHRLDKNYMEIFRETFYRGSKNFTMALANLEGRMEHAIRYGVPSLDITGTYPIAHMGGLSGTGLTHKTAQIVTLREPLMMPNSSMKDDSDPSFDTWSILVEFTLAKKSDA